MALQIEDYALIGDTQAAALVGRDGSIDWACLPRFDSGACFAALLGSRENGRWAIQPEGPFRPAGRRYRPGTLVLETDFEADGGAATVIDFMPVRGPATQIVRIVEGRRGAVDFRSDLVIRFDHGRIIPWVRRREGALVAVGGPDALSLRADVEVHGEDMASVSQFRVGAGERRAFVLTWFPSHEEPPEPTDPTSVLQRSDRWWRFWSHRCTPWEPWSEAVGTSLRVLKALTYGPTGGMVAAPTASLPEQPGGVRNWDYRYCWLRDATLTLYALMLAGYSREAEAWREWLLRAVAGDPARLQTIYGVAGERRLPEYEADWLDGYENARPVRFGNDAYSQLQLDVYGEVLDALYAARRFGIAPDRWAWPLEQRLLETLEGRWREPDEGIWEIRGPRQHFTHSKVMSWVAFDRAIRSVEEFGLPGPIDRWRAIRAEIHAEVCARAFDPHRNTFVQAFDRPAVDANLLMIPLVGFLPPHDPRVAGTVAAIERELLVDGFVQRYRTEDHKAVDGLPPGEGVFLPCSFWLADAYVELGRRNEAQRLFERLIALRNDVGLLPEEYDPRGRRFLGNFPQAFSHLALVNTAYNLLAGAERPSHQRHKGGPHAALTAPL
jgi:GH15 family glucan-1,4-alpha-glucosidase